MLRVGPYGDGFGAEPDGLTLEVLEANPHGVDLGPHRERVPEVLRTPSGKIELAPEPIVADVERLQGALARERNGGLVLIGRRQLRSNNSWMHNLPALVKGKDRCTLHVHPDDAERLGLEDGGRAVISSAAGQIEAPVEVTDGIMPGVVSIPHGWGHDAPGVKMRVASDHAGVNTQRAGRRVAGGPAVGQRRAERHPGRGARPAVIPQSASRSRQPGPQIGESMLPPQVRQVTFAVSDMRAIVEWAPQLGHSERSSKRRRQ